MELDRYPAQRAAARYLLGHIEAGAWVRTGRLPGLPTLARAAGVSHVSMWKALHALQRDGLVVITHGQGVRLASQSGPVSAAPPRVTRAEHAMQALTRDLFNGVFTAGQPLASRKELAERYGVSPRTLRAALDRLESQGVLETHRRQLRVPRFSATRPSVRVALIGWAAPSGSLLMRTPWSEEMVRLLERECSNARLHLDIISYYFLRDGTGPFYNTAQARSARDLPLHRDTLGCVLWAESPHGESMTVLGALAKRKVPVAVLEEGTRYDVGRWHSPSSPVKLFSMATNEQAGYQVGRLLRELGHDHAAFISPFHLNEWSLNRLNGLRRAYTTESGGQMSPFTFDKLRYATDVRAMVRPAILGKARSWWSDAPSHARAVLESAERRVREATVSAIEHEVLRAMVAPLFARARSEPMVSAWVCCNDQVATLALEFLGGSGGRPEVCVAGFDDSSEALGLGLTSFGANASGAVQAMLGHVLGRGPRAAGARVEIDGVVVERGSTWRRGARG